MEKGRFLIQLAEQLELDEYIFSEATILKDLDGYDSMAVMSLVAFVDENFSLQLSSEQIVSITTIESLMKMIGLENFESS